MPDLSAVLDVEVHLRRRFSRRALHRNAVSWHTARSTERPPELDQSSKTASATTLYVRWNASSSMVSRMKRTSAP